MQRINSDIKPNSETCVGQIKKTKNKAVTFFLLSEEGSSSLPINTFKDVRLLTQCEKRLATFLGQKRSNIHFLTSPFVLVPAVLSTFCRLNLLVGLLLKR